MIVTRIKGGLGNQLFQYAIGRNLALRHSTELKLDLSWFQQKHEVPGLEMFSRRFQLDAFDIAASVASEAEVSKFMTPKVSRFGPQRIHGFVRRVRKRVPALCAGLAIREKDTRFNARLLRMPDNIYLEGWWQSERYFERVADTLKAELSFRDRGISQRAVDFILTVRKKDAPIVAVHVRRGDVARAHETLRDLRYMPYTLLPKEYFQSAMARFGDDATFVVFSDTGADIEWCRANLVARDMHFRDARSDLDDFAVMARCDHNIISNSSFSWWSAWLNSAPERVVMAPGRWYREGYAVEHSIHTIIPHSWLICSEGWRE